MRSRRLAEIVFTATTTALLSAAIHTSAMAGGRTKGTIFVMQGYSGKPQRSPDGQGTSAIKIRKHGSVSLWGPGNSPHQLIHTKKGFVP